MTNRPPRITVGDLIRQLRVFSESDELSFNGLDFYRLKKRGPDLVQVEFNQLVYRDDTGKLIVNDSE